MPEPEQLIAGEILTQDIQHIIDFALLLKGCQGGAAEDSEAMAENTPGVTIEQIRSAAYQSACDYVDQLDDVKLTGYESEVLITVSVLAAVEAVAYLIKPPL